MLYRLYLGADHIVAIIIGAERTIFAMGAAGRKEEAEAEHDDFKPGGFYDDAVIDFNSWSPRRRPYCRISAAAMTGIGGIYRLAIMPASSPADRLKIPKWCEESHVGLKSSLLAMSTRRWR